MASDAEHSASSHLGREERSARPERPKRTSRRRRRRWVILLLVVLLSTTAYVMTRPSVLRSIIEPTLSRSLGGNVTLGDVRLSGWLRVSIGAMTVKAEGWTGPAAEVASATDINIDLLVMPLLVGRVEIRALQFGSLRIRSAEREEQPGTFNILALRGRTRAEGDHLRPVRIDLGRLDLESGSVNALGEWTLLGTRSFSGFLSPDPARADGTLFAFRLADRAQKDGTAGSQRSSERQPSLEITGTWDERSFALDLRLAALELDDRVIHMLPFHLRRSALAMALAGSIRSAVLRWSPDAPLFAEFNVADMQLVVPELGLGERWSRFRNGKREGPAGLPTMRVREGTVRLEGSKVRFQQLVGEIASSATEPGSIPLPIALGLDVDLDTVSLAGVNLGDPTARQRWITETFRVAPFTLSIGIRGFDSSTAPAGEPPILEIPTPVAAALETFGVTAWRLDVEAEFSRGPPTRDANGVLLPAAVKTQGQCYLSHGKGSYDAFPYPLTDVKAHVAFEQSPSGADRLVVNYLAGTTNTGSTISMSGTVTEPGAQAALDLTIAAPTFVLDEHLVRCFEQGNHKTLAYLFHKPSFDALARANLLPTDDVSELEARLQSLYGSLATIADPDERARLDDERARIERKLSVRPFALGGKGAITARLRRAAGPDQPLRVTGTVTILRAGVLIDEFPYPLVVTSGTLSISEEEVSFGRDGLRATTLEGGLVRITGRMAIEPHDGGTRVSPEITITGVDDRVTPLLLAAIPPARGEPVEGWPGAALVPTARLLEASGLRGTVDLFGTIVEPPAVSGRPRRPETTLRIEITDGSIDSQAAPQLPLALPAGLSLREVSASLLVTLDAVEFRSMRARDADGIGTILASGTFSTVDRTECVDIRFENVALAPWVIESLPENARDAGRTWWARCRPEGRFDAHLTISSGDHGATFTSLEARPRTFTWTPFDTTVAVRGVDGGLTLLADGTGVRMTFDGLRFTDGLEDDAGQIEWLGSLVASSSSLESLELTARASNMRWESPLVPTLLETAGADELAAAIQRRHPAGRFDGTLTYALPHRETDGQSPASPAWQLSLSPRSLALDLPIGNATTRPTATFAPGGLLEATAQEVTFKGIEGVMPSGTFRLNGNVDLRTTPHRLRGDLRVDATTWAPEIASLLPPPLHIARDKIGFEATHFLLDHATVALDWDPLVGLASPSRYTIAGDLSTRGGALSAGVPFTDVDGDIQFRFGYEAQGSTPTIELDAHIAAPQFRIYDRLLTEGSTHLTLSPDGTTLAMRGIQGEIAGGRVVGEAAVRFDEKRYNADIRILGASLAPLIAPRDPNSASGGSVDARLTVEGPTNGTAGRSGRGRIAIRDAAMANSPFTLRLLQLSQLMLPLSTSLKTADIQFYLKDEKATFERFELTTEGLILDGEGSIDTRDFAVDLLLRSRGRLGIVSDIVGAVSDQLYLIEVKGPLENPTAGIVALPSLRGRSSTTPASPPTPSPPASPPAEERR